MLEWLGIAGELRFPSVRDRPLRHLSALESTSCEQSTIRISQNALHVYSICDPASFQRLAGTSPGTSQEIVIRLLRSFDHLRRSRPRRMRLIGQTVLEAAVDSRARYYPHTSDACRRDRRQSTPPSDPIDQPPPQKLEARLPFRAGLGPRYRSGLNAARSSDAKSVGSSHAAKCPPRLASLK